MQFRGFPFATPDIGVVFVFRNQVGFRLFRFALVYSTSFLFAPFHFTRYSFVPFRLGVIHIDLACSLSLREIRRRFHFRFRFQYGILFRFIFAFYLGGVRVELPVHVVRAPSVGASPSHHRRPRTTGNNCLQNGERGGKREY